MKDERIFDVKEKGFHVNTKQRGTNELRKGKECKIGRQDVEKLRICKLHICEIGLEDSRSC